MACDRDRFANFTNEAGGQNVTWTVLASKSACQTRRNANVGPVGKHSARCLQGMRLPHARQDRANTRPPIALQSAATRPGNRRNFRRFRHGRKRIRARGPPRMRRPEHHRADILVTRIARPGGAQTMFATRRGGTAGNSGDCRASGRALKRNSAGRVFARS